MKSKKTLKKWQIFKKKKEKIISEIRKREEAEERAKTK